MARNVRTFVGNDTPSDEDLRPKHLSKQEFSRRLYKLITDKGWNQSELARQAGVTRDAVSTYINSKSLPDPKNAAKIAAALGITVQELLPNQIEQAIDRDPPAFEIKASAHNPNVSWLRINRLVSTDLALEIAGKLRDDKIPDGD